MRRRRGLEIRAAGISMVDQRLLHLKVFYVILGGYFGFISKYVVFSLHPYRFCTISS